MKTVKLGIVGVGGMGWAQLEHFERIAGVKIVACADPNGKRAEEVAARFGIKGIYTDYLEMLDKERLDAVTNVTADSAHYPVAMDVLKRKISILSEKPLATTLKDAQKMRDAAQSSGVTNMVNFSYRNGAALQRGAAFIRSGALGKVLHVEASYIQDWHFNLDNCGWVNGAGEPEHWALWRCSHNRGGTGVFGDIGCHIYDFTTMLCNETITEIASMLQTYPKSANIEGYDMDANNSFVSAVKFAGGGQGVIHVTHAAPGHGNEIRCKVFCENGALEYDSSVSDAEYKLFKRGARQNWKTVVCKPTPSNYERFIKAVRTGKPSEDGNDFANGCKIQAYLHYGFESAAKKKTVQVKL